MAGYAASGRITNARPRLAGPGMGWTRRGDAHVVTADPDRDEVRALDLRPLDQRVSETWAQARDEWAQATFFLFDPNSWR